MSIVRHEGLAYDATATENSAEGAQLLNDGRVLILRGGGDGGDGTTHAWILEPDAYGSYAGRVARRIADCQAGHHGAPMILHDDGRVSIHGDHPGALGFGGEGISEVFDPVTETWTVSYNHHNHANRPGAVPLEDGRVAAFSASATGTRSIHLIDRNGYNQAAEVPAGSTGFGHLEGCLAQLPDGRIFVNETTNTRGWRWAAVQYPGSHVAAGSVDAATGYLTAAEAITWDPTRGNWKGGSRWFNNHRELPEGGLGIYMPRVDRIAYVTPLGDLFTCHPDHPTEHVWSSSPRWIPSTATGWPDPVKVVGAVASWNAGTGTLVVDCQAASSMGAAGTYVGHIGVETTAGAVLVRYTATAISGDGAWKAGNQATYTGCTLDQWDTGGVISVGARCVREQPFPGLSEGPLCILPSGMLLMPLGFMLGTSSLVPGWIEYPTLWVWNGVDDPYELPDSLVDAVGDNGDPTKGYPFYAISYELDVVLLPTGQVLIVDAADRYFYLYTPEGDEAVIPGGYAPTIESFPGTVRAGFTYRLQGRQLWGRHYGAFSGDDWLGHCNNPQARLVATTHDGTGHKVFYCPTTRYSYRGIQADRRGHMDVAIPAGVPAGTYTLEVVSNGVASPGLAVTVTAGGAATPRFAASGPVI